MKNARGLTKNPLGIIGLFISLIYGFACLVLSTSISNLQSACERIPLIWFIIIFPIIILGAFIYLVVNHHEKLYAPSDFRNDDSFIETMTGRRIKEKQQKEAEILMSTEDSESEDNVETETHEEESNEQTTEQKTNIETLPVDAEQLEVTISNAEEWGIKDLELEFNIQFRTNQRIVINGRPYELDAYAADSRRVFIAEVKYWQSHKALKPLKISIQRFARQAEQFNRGFGNKEVNLVFVLVLDNVTKSVLNPIRNFVNDLEQDIELRIKGYSELKKDYRE